MSQQPSIEGSPGCVYTLSAAEEPLEQACAAIRARSHMGNELRREVLANVAPQIIVAGQALARAFTRQATLIAFGEGVSSYDAQALVQHLLQPPFPHWRPLPALILPACSGLLSMNNEEERVMGLARQVSLWGRCGDIALAFALPGNEDQVNAALVQAKRQDLLTIALVSAASPLLSSSSVDFCFAVPGEQRLPLREMQATLAHSLLEIVYACVETRPPARERRAAILPRVRRPFALDIR